MMKTIAIDDERIALERIKRIAKEEGSFAIVNTYTDPLEALKNIDTDMPEVVFLDIGMTDINGIEFAEKLLAIKPEIKIVFLTAYESYALQAFKVHAIGYLLKPIVREDLRREAENIRLKTQSVHSEKRTKLEITCFGRFAIQNGEQTISFRTAKAEELAAFLVHNCNNPVTRDVIIENLWPDMKLDAAINNFHVTMHYTKNSLAQADRNSLLLRKREGYVLNTDNIELDVCKFNAMVQQLEYFNYSDEIVLEQAAKIYGDRYFNDTGYLWAIERQSKFEATFIKIQMRLFDIYKEKKQFNTAIATMNNLIAYDPLLEHAYEKLIRLYIDLGEKEMANGYYNQMRKTIKSELGIDISWE